MPRDFFFTPPHTAFILANAAAICSSASLLGGPVAEARVHRLIDEASLASPLNSRLERELDALENLLSLENVQDFDSVEAERFALIDPSDPVVEEICLLLDGLRHARAQTAVMAA
jgi:hypothetical protein